MGSKKISWWVILLILLALIVGFFAGSFISGKSFTRKLFLNNGNKVDVIMDIINEDYVDPVDINSLIENALPKIIDELDPHSSYIPASELAGINEGMDGHFGGIGIEFMFHLDTLIVISVIHGGPSEQAGILAGDRLISVNGEYLIGNSYSEEKILSTLRGNIGTIVKMGIIRPPSDEIKTYDVIIGSIPLTTVKAAYEVAEGIGLIKIYDKFSHTTYDEFLTAIAKLMNKGCNSFIIDLRMNNGGAFETAIEICNEFLPRGKNIVYIEGKSFPKEDFFANGLGTLQENQVVILVDQISASASEIVAGAIQDNDRGLIIGRRSFGKGLVQNQIELSDGSALRLTIARYFSPSGRNIQRKYELGKADEYNQEWLDRFYRGEGFFEDTIINDSLNIFQTTNGRQVYGGGGIMPDIFVPVDTSELTSYYVNLETKHIFSKFALDYTDANRNKLSEFTNYDDMLEYLNTQPLLYEVVLYAEKEGIRRRSSLIRISANQIINTTAAYIIRNFFGDEAFFPVFMSNDNVVLKAVEVIQQGLAHPEAIATKQYLETLEE